jgi:hypothetical protein
MRFALCLVAAMLLAVGGCNAPVASSAQTIGPSAEDQEAALELVWEGVYGMTLAQRPAITWLPVDDASDEYSTLGNMRIRWTGALISDTHFSVWLEGDREWLVYPSGELAPAAEVDRLTHQAQDSLRAAGL